MVHFKLVITMGEFVSQSFPQPHSYTAYSYRTPISFNCSTVYLLPFNLKKYVTETKAAFHVHA